MAARRRDRSNWGSHMTTPYLQKIKREAAQAAFVAQWRAEHAGAVWCSDGWRCPLCNLDVQAFTARDVMYIATQHQIDHGQDWERYQAAGADRATGEQ